jgi:catechol 2,3-dioxygenase-like lactoylglutathione lyase family enzyme
VGIVGLDHVQVAAPPGCEDSARAFYGEALGLEEIPKPPLLAGRGGCWFRLGAHELHVGVADGFVPAAKAHPGIEVDSAAALRELAQQLADAGVTVEWADPAELGGRERFHVRDPWGNRLELVVGR